MEKEKWKEWITRNLIADELLNLGPCFVKHISLIADDAQSASVLIYNGHDTSGDIFFSILVSKYKDFSDDFAIPVYFNKGLYVDIGEYVASFIIQYKPI